MNNMKYKIPEKWEKPFYKYDFIPFDLKKRTTIIEELGLANRKMQRLKKRNSPEKRIQTNKEEEDNLEREKSNEVEEKGNDEEKGVFELPLSNTILISSIEESKKQELEEVRKSQQERESGVIEITEEDAESNKSSHIDLSSDDYKLKKLSVDMPFEIGLPDKHYSLHSKHSPKGQLTIDSLESKIFRDNHPSSYHHQNNDNLQIGGQNQPLRDLEKGKGKGKHGEEGDIEAEGVDDSDRMNKNKEEEGIEEDTERAAFHDNLQQEKEKLDKSLTTISTETKFQSPNDTNMQSK